jgi:hypothetical protein
VGLAGGIAGRVLSRDGSVTLVGPAPAGGVRSAGKPVMGRDRDKVEEDLRLGGLSANTHQTYLRCAAGFVLHCGKGPMRTGRAEVRDFWLHLLEERKVTVSAFGV